MRWNVLTRWAVLAAVVVTGCSRSPEPAQPAPVFERVEAEQGFTRYAVEPVPVPRRFREAIERGTRTERGGAGAPVLAAAGRLHHRGGAGPAQRPLAG